MRVQRKTTNDTFEKEQISGIILGKQQMEGRDSSQEANAMVQIRNDVEPNIYEYPPQTQDQELGIQR